MNKKLQLQQEYGHNKQKDQQQLQVHQQQRGSQQQQEGNNSGEAMHRRTGVTVCKLSYSLARATVRSCVQALAAILAQLGNKHLFKSLMMLNLHSASVLDKSPRIWPRGAGCCAWFVLDRRRLNLPLGLTSLTLSLPTPNDYMSPLSFSARNLPPPSPANLCVFLYNPSEKGKVFSTVGRTQNRFCRRPVGCIMRFCHPWELSM